METKIYRFYGIDTAMELLRPGAKWEITNSHFSRWRMKDPNLLGKKSWIRWRKSRHSRTP